MMNNSTYNTLRPSRTIDLRKRRAWFEEAPPATPATPPAPAATPPTTPPPAADKTFTQADLDKYAGNARKEAKHLALTELAKKHGADTPEALEERLKKLTDLEASQLTEQEKLQKAAEKAISERDAAIAERDSEKQGRLIDKRNTAIEAAASKAHAEVPADVILWAVTYHADLLEKVMDADGVVKSAEVEKLINTCKEERKSWFVRGGGGSPSNRDGRVPQPGEKEMEQARGDVRRQVRRSM